MVKRGKPVEVKDHPLSDSGMQGTIALCGDSPPGYSGQAGEEASICRYQVEGRPLGGDSLELRPE